MADTVISDAVKAPHDEGLPNIADGNEDWGSAGLIGLLAQANHADSYIRDGLTFSGHDATNNTIDVDPGVCYLSLSGETIDVQSALGGSIPPAYDTVLPDEPSILIVLPTTVTASLQDAALSQLWVAYATDNTVTGVSAGDVYVRSDDTGSVSSPPHPSVELGSANPDNASSDVLLNRESPGGLVPSGVITMWNGAISSIPDGWTLCDGTNGTPDLRDRFVTGAGGQYAVGDTGGEDEHTLTTGELPSHSHQYATSAQNSGSNHDAGETASGEVDSNPSGASAVGPSTETVGSGEAHENRPPYYALAYIMKL